MGNAKKMAARQLADQVDSKPAIQASQQANTPKRCRAGKLASCQAIKLALLGVNTTVGKKSPLDSRATNWKACAFCLSQQAVKKQTC